MLILGPFRCLTMTVGNNGGSVHSVILDAGNDGVSVRGIVTNGRNGCICGYYECLLGRGVSDGRHSSDRTHVKDLKNIFEA